MKDLTSKAKSDYGEKIVAELLKGDFDMKKAIKYADALLKYGAFRTIFRNSVPLGYYISGLEEDDPDCTSYERGIPTMVYLRKD